MNQNSLLTRDWKLLKNIYIIISDCSIVQIFLIEKLETEGGENDRE